MSIFLIAIQSCKVCSAPLQLADESWQTGSLLQNYQLAHYWKLDEVLTMQATTSSTQPEDVIKKYFAAHHVYYLKQGILTG